MTTRILTLAFALAAIATTAPAQTLKGLDTCSRNQVRYYVDQGLTNGEIRQLCATGGGLNCPHEKCDGAKVDALIAEGFSDADLDEMCGQPLCPAEAEQSN